MNDDNVRENAFVLINPENIFRFFSAESLVEQENQAELFLRWGIQNLCFWCYFTFPFHMRFQKQIPASVSAAGSNAFQYVFVSREFPHCSTISMRILKAYQNNTMNSPSRLATLDIKNSFEEN